MDKLDKKQIQVFVANRFRTIREADSEKPSARLVSLELGQSSQYINQIECGHKMPSIEGLFNFCDYFSMPVSTFFDDTQEYPMQYMELISYLNKLDKDELSEVVAIAKRYAKSKKF